MMKILLISDTHGLTDDIIKIKNRHDVNGMIHCGDSELAMDAKELNGFIKVAGNCDRDARYPMELTKNIENINFFITHGHHYGVKMNLTNLSYRGEEVGAHIICYGHTHIAGVEKIGQQLLINPGSIRAPRHRVERTYVIIKWNDQAIHVKFYEVDGQYVEELSTSYALKELNI